MSTAPTTGVYCLFVTAFDPDARTLTAASEHGLSAQSHQPLTWTVSDDQSWFEMSSHLARAYCESIGHDFARLTDCIHPVRAEVLWCAPFRR